MLPRRNGCQIEHDVSKEKLDSKVNFSRPSQPLPACTPEDMTRQKAFLIFFGSNLLLNAQLLEVTKQKSGTFRSEKAWVQNFHWFSNSSLKFYASIATLADQAPCRLGVNLLVRVPCLRSFSQNAKFSSLDFLWLKALLWWSCQPLSTSEQALMLRHVLK